MFIQKKSLLSIESSSDFCTRFTLHRKFNVRRFLSFNLPNLQPSTFNLPNLQPSTFKPSTFQTFNLQPLNLQPSTFQTFQLIPHSSL